MVADNSLKNLKEFKKGRSGNPSGRPVGSKNLTTQAARILKKVAPESYIKAKNVRGLLVGKRVTVADAIAALWIRKALQGDMKAIKELNDRFEGRPRQALDVAGSDGGPVEIVYRVVYEDE